MAEIPGLSFGSTVNVLKEGLSGAGLEQTQIANNIANVNTPNYRRTTTDFKELLAESLGTPPSKSELPMETNSARQFAIGDGAPPKPFDPVPIIDTGTQMRVDRSNVDIDQEMAHLSMNSGYAQDMAKLLLQQYNRYSEAIKEQP